MARPLFLAFGVLAGMLSCWWVGRGCHVAGPPRNDMWALMAEMIGT